MAGVVGNVVAGIGQAGQAAQQNAPATEQQNSPVVSASFLVTDTMAAAHSCVREGQAVVMHFCFVMRGVIGNTVRTILKQVTSQTTTSRTRTSPFALTPEASGCRNGRRHRAVHYLAVSQLPVC